MVNIFGAENQTSSIRECELGEAVEKALTALLGSRLAVLAGAGLSMDPPSSLPSAAMIADAAKAKYASLFGAQPPLPNTVEGQAEYFFRRGDLVNVYFRMLIDRDAFAGRFNEGHLAIADLLLVNGFETGITTNVDRLIENAGEYIFGQIGAGVEIDKLPLGAPSLLKIHGCRSIDPDHMVWAPGQLSSAPVSTRLADSASWIAVRLRGKDLLIVGYWTDWDYLNTVLREAFGAATPTRVIIVNPADSADLEKKAPELSEIGRRASVEFLHVRVTGKKFLEKLRSEFSRCFLRRVLHSARQGYTDAHGTDVKEDWLEPPSLDNETMWMIRRDLEGRSPREPAKLLQPPDDDTVGLTLVQLRARGAVADGPYWNLKGVRFRVVRAANRLLNRVEEAFEGDSSPVTAADVTIAVGADRVGLPSRIVRSGSEPNIARGGGGRWVTRAEAVEEFHL